MSTRSNVLYNTGEKIISNYVHFDGYLSGVGLELFQHFNDEDKVKKLFKRKNGIRTIHEGKLDFYPENSVEAIEFDSIREYWNSMQGDCFIEYIYYFDKDKKWYVSFLDSVNPAVQDDYIESVCWVHTVFKPLEQALEEEL